MNFEISIYITKPATDVFTYISNFSNHKDMISANIDSKQTSEGPVQVGTTMRNIARFMGMKMEEHFVVTEFVQDKLIAKQSVQGSTYVTGDKMTLEEMKGVTNLTVFVYAELKGFIKLFDGFLERKVRDSLTADMERLKRDFESGRI